MTRREKSEEGKKDWNAGTPHLMQLARSKFPCVANSHLSLHLFFCQGQRLDYSRLSAYFKAELRTFHQIPREEYQGDTCSTALSLRSSKRRPEPALYFKSLDLVHPLQDTAQVHEDETDEDHFQELGQAGLPEAIIPS